MADFSGLPIASSDIKDIVTEVVGDQLDVRGRFRSRTLLRALDETMVAVLVEVSSEGLKLESPFVRIMPPSLRVGARYTLRGLAGAIHRGWIYLDFSVGARNSVAHVHYENYEWVLEGFNVVVDVVLNVVVKETIPRIGNAFAQRGGEAIDVLMKRLAGAQIPVQLMDFSLAEGGCPFRVRIG